MNPTTPTVFVVDDDDAVRRALERLLRASGFVVETYESAQKFLERPAALGPGCLLLDVKMPKLNGMDLQAELAAKDIRTPVIFLTGYGDIPMTVKALKRGAADFLTKPYRAEELLAAVRAAIAKDLAQRSAREEADAIRQRVDTLTDRERQVLALVTTGLLNKQIAAELGNSERTVKVHRARVMQKMQAVSVAELTRMLERSGIDLTKDAPRDSGPTGGA